MAGIRSAMRSPMRSALDQALGTAYMSLTNQALAVLRKFGSNAHVYIPGAGGVAVSGLSSSNFTLSDGSTGLSAIDGTAGLVLDAAGSSSVVVNIGSTTVGPIGAGFMALSASIPVVANRAYQFTYVVSALTGNVSTSLFGQANGAQQTAVGTYTETLFATANATISVGLLSRGAGITSMTASVTVTEVTGIHATQATTANKPAQRRGLYNLLTYSNDLSNAAWTAVQSVASYGVTDPNGGSTASKFVGNSTDGSCRHSSVTLAANTPVTGAVWLRVPSGTLSTKIQVANQALSTLNSATVNLTTSWQLFAVNATLGGADTGAVFSIGGFATVGNGVEVDCYAAGLFAGTLTAAQILAEGGIPLTTSAAASNGAAGRYSWQFDGTNDSLALAVANTGAQGVMIGAFRPNNAHFGSVLCSGGDGVGNPGCGIGVDSNSRASFLFGDGTTTNQRINSGSTTIVGAAHVISAVWGTASQKLRVDGNQVGTGAVSVVPVSSGGISIGRIHASADYFSGAVGTLVFISGTVSDADLLTLERWVAANTPAGPTF